eukprot:7670707-Lingulodinium_polyedra.AAC.1
MYAPWGARVVNCIIGGEPEQLVFIPKAGDAIDVHGVLEVGNYDWGADEGDDYADGEPADDAGQHDG